jgi:hypothetical protein
MVKLPLRAMIYYVQFLWSAAGCKADGIRKAGKREKNRGRIAL